jgi:hypothetical protein
MFARVTVIEGDPARFEEVREFITSQAAPRSRGLPGLQANYWLGDSASGRVLILGVSASQESLRATADTVAGWRQQDVPALGGRVVAVDEYEVIA